MADPALAPAAPPRRVLLKLSGEALMGENEYGIDPEVAREIAGQVADAASDGTQVAIVVGGGNIFRGLAASARGMDRSTGDYMGMLATVMNGLAIQDALEQSGQPTRVMSAIAMNEICEPYIRRRAVRHLTGASGSGSSAVASGADAATVHAASGLDSSTSVRVARVGVEVGGVSAQA